MAKKKKVQKGNLNEYQNDITGGIYSEIQQNHNSLVFLDEQELPPSSLCTSKMIDGEIYRYCPCGGYLFEIKLNDQHWYRCGDCGNDYNINMKFTNSRTDRMNGDKI